MDLLEYQGKTLLARAGVPVPEGKAAQTPDEVRQAAAEISGRVVVKAQVLIGGRGKAGGIQLAESPDEAREHAEQILGMDISGHTVRRVWIEPAADIAAEYYASFMLDRSNRRHLGIVSAQGGVDIEQVAASDPDAVVQVGVDPVLGLTNWQATELVFRAGLAPEATAEAVRTLHRLYGAFVEFDCDLVEINPLILTSEGRIVALDAKVTLDDSAFFRHKGFADLALEHEVDPIERLARDRGLNFIALDGDVGIIGNGAGLVMSTLDVVSLVGGSASNFLDVGGGAGSETISNALEVLTQDQTVKVVLVNIFGGITRGDLVAQGILDAVARIDLPWPMVVRLDGTNAEEGRALLAESQISSLVSAATMREAAEKAVGLAAGESA